jgi:osmotically-inducible protein OsmY
VLLTAERGTVLADDDYEVETVREAEIDTTMLNLVDSALRRAGRHALRHVQIYLDDSHVTLRGRVRSYYHKQLAQHAALAVNGVLSIDNRLAVD